jgi:hypothetical protein
MENIFFFLALCRGCIEKGRSRIPGGLLDAKVFLRSSLLFFPAVCERNRKEAQANHGKCGRNRFILRRPLFSFLFFSWPHELFQIPSAAHTGHTTESCWQQLPLVLLFLLQLPWGEGTEMKLRGREGERLLL